jgi:methyltransferase (TIGR00027 family)
MSAGDTIAVRTRYLDDQVQESVRAGARQLVLPAAGMDTRAWRLELPDGVTVFEIDRPDLLALKDHLLDGARTRSSRTTVPADLTADWPAALRAAGHDPGRPTCWVVEGLLQYLPEGAVLGLFDALTAASVPGSHLLTDFVGAELLRAPAAQPMLAAMREQGSPWLFATADPAPLFTARGWGPAVSGFAEVSDRLGRPSGFGPLSSGLGYLVHATR